MTVTQLKQSSGEKFVLVLDDGTEVKTTLSVLTEFFVCIGTVFDENRFNEFYAASSLAQCKERSLRIINARPMSCKEMHDRLIEKGENEENAEHCVKWLCDMGLINDRSYAASLVRHYAAKGYGRTRIVQELKRHGIERDMWDNALLEMPEQDDKLRSFIAARLHDPDDKAQVQKVSNALFRRGYSWDEIRHSINTYKCEEFQ